MVHGPCGHLNQSSPCMVDGSCSKNFPKQFCQNTVASDNGYPKYRRRDNGRTVSVKNVDLDNRWIVPYNAWLSKKVQCSYQPRSLYECQVCEVPLQIHL